MLRNTDFTDLIQDFTGWPCGALREKRGKESIREINFSLLFPSGVLLITGVSYIYLASSSQENL